MPGPISRIVKGVGAGIGMASEAIADYKEKKAAKQHEDQAAAGGSQGPSGAEHHPEKEGHSKDAKAMEKSGHEDSSSEGEDELEETWALDEAAHELDPPPYSEIDHGSSPTPVDDLVKSFVSKHNTTITGGEGSESAGFKPRPLPLPVIIPQRRPKDKSRGFVQAYAPMLGEYSGIDQQTFLDFIRDFHRASLASPVFQVVNLAAFAVGLVPNPIAMGVSIAVQVISQTGQELQARHRTNTYLDQINETLFKPRGLYAMIMTFKPDQSQSAVLAVDTSSTDAALFKSLSVPESDLSKKLKNLRLSSGATQGELSLPESAPLVFPAIDAAAAHAATSLDSDAGKHELQKIGSTGSSTSSDDLKKQQSALKSSGEAVSSYLDRRAQALYASMNPHSRLAMPPPEKKFASRFADPNHPANSGSIVALLTGGHFDLTAARRVRRARRRAAWRGEVLTEVDIKNAEMDRLPRDRFRRWKGQGLIRRVMQKNVLYLMICNLPSEAEMEEMRRILVEKGKLKDSHGDRSPGSQPAVH